MSKFFSQLFSRKSSSKRSKHGGSQPSINEDVNRRSTTSSGTTMRAAASEENLSRYRIDPKQLEKNKLHKASYEGDLNKVNRLVQPSTIDRPDQQRRTPLHYAIDNGNINIVKHLVHEGAKLNVMDEQRRTPLIKAVITGTSSPHVTQQICDILLREGSSQFINAIDAYGRNALHYAVLMHNEPIVAMLISYPQCDPNLPDRDGMTPLHLAAQTNSPSLAFALLSETAEIPTNSNLQNREGQTPLHLAAIAGYNDVIKVLIQAPSEFPCNPTITDAHMLTPAQLARALKHEDSATLIDSYARNFTSQTQTPGSTASKLVMGMQPPERATMFSPTGRLDQDQDDDDSTSDSDDDSSTASSGQIQISGGQWNDQSDSHQPSQKDPQKKSLAELIRSNPVQPSSASASAAAQSAVPPRTGQPSSSTLGALMAEIPLRPGQSTTTSVQQTSLGAATSNSPTMTSRPTHQLPSNPSSFQDALIKANPLAEAVQTNVPKKTVTINSLITPHSQNERSESVSPSWSQDGHPAVSIHDKSIKPAQKMDTWSSSSSNASHTDDESGSRNDPTHTLPPPPTVFQQNQPFSALNGTSMFTPSHLPADPIVRSKSDDESDEDSVEQIVKSMTKNDPSIGLKGLVIQSIAPTGKPSPSGFMPSPREEDSTWSTSSITADHGPMNGGIFALAQQHPLTGTKPTDTNLDDSRPLSADLKDTQTTQRKPTKESFFSSSSSSTVTEDSDDDEPGRAPTSAKPNPGVSGLLMSSIRPPPTEMKTGGIENLTKIIQTITSQPQTTQKPTTTVVVQTTSQTTSTKNQHGIERLIVSPMLQRNESMSSSRTSSLIDETVRNMNENQMKSPVRQNYRVDDDDDDDHSQRIMNSGRDFEILKSKRPVEMLSSSQRQFIRTSIDRDINGLRGSMSSSTSSIQNNMERLTEIREDLKVIERRQEDQFELKRQLKEMEIKKNNFEALYKKHDELLRSTEAKLEKETNEKQRLEWTSKTLNMELKNVKERLESLEDERNSLQQRCLKLKEEKENYDEKLRTIQNASLQTTTTAVLREEDIEKIKSRHREELKLLSAENDELHQRTKQLQSDLQLHKESLDVTIRYKIDLEKALEEKAILQMELDRLKHERDTIEQDKLEYKTKYDALQDEIRTILSDRSKLEQKLTNELQEQIKQRQRTTDDVKKYKTQIEQLNMKLGDAEARLLVLQTQNEALLASKDREIKTEFESLTQRLNQIESEKFNAEQRYQNEHKEILNKQQQQQQHVLHEPLVILTSTPLSNAAQNHHQHSPSSPCGQCNKLQRSYEQEREQRLQTERDNDHLRDVVSRQKKTENERNDQNKEMRSETERVKQELERLRHDFNRLIMNYEPNHQNGQQQRAQIHSKIDDMRHLHEDDYRQRHRTMSNETKPTIPMTNGYHSSTVPITYDHHHHSSSSCSICSNTQVLKDRLDTAIDLSLADQRIKAMKQMQMLPRQRSPVTSVQLSPSYSSMENLRKRYYL